MSASLPLLLRIPLTNESGFVLVRVEKIQGRSGALDVKLVATDSEQAFAFTLKQEETSKLKTSSSKISQKQWEDILAFIFLEILPEETDQSFTTGIEAVAVVKSRLIEITIQKRIEGITQKLGQIHLAVQDNEDDIDLYEWCGEAVKSKAAMTAGFEALTDSLRKKDEEIKQLHDAWEQLIKLKTQTEDDQLEKFALLLNEKKLKIREQQRLMASSKFDPTKLEEVEGTQIVSEKTPGVSGSRKRKVESEEESDAGFEKMEVDAPEEENQEDQNQDDDVDQVTASDTASDSDSDPPPIVLPGRKAANKNVEPEVADKSSKVHESNSLSPPPARRTRGASSQPVVAKDPSERPAIPPKRDLPFATRKEPPPPRKAAPVDDDSTDSDDEL